MEKLNNDELCRFINKHKRSILGIEAAEEILKRDLSKKYLMCIIEWINPGNVTQRVKEVAQEIIEEATKKIIKQGFLDEEILLTILNKIESPEIKKEATEEYFSKHKIVRNYILRKIIELIPSMRRKAARRLLKQNPSPDDLLTIEEELKGKLQIEAWQRHWQMGMDLDDACWLIGFVESLAEITWKRLYQEKGIKEISNEHLYEISEYTDSLKVKRGVLNEMWLRKESLGKEQLRYIRKNAKMIIIEDPEEVRKWVEKKLGLELLGMTYFEENQRPLEKRVTKQTLKKAQKEIEEIERKKTSPKLKK